jgi:tRNA(fMet)-specific endonuclease VapC
VKFVLDTNTVSLLMRGEAGVTRRLMSRSRNEVLLPQPVVAEIEYGLARLPPSARLRMLRRRFTIILAELARADWTDGVSRAFGKIKANLERRGVRLEDFDVAVAAHALARAAVLVTDNVADMDRIEGLRVENWRERET